MMPKSIGKTIICKELKLHPSYVDIVGVTGSIPVTSTISSSRKLRSALINKRAKSVHKDVWHAYHNAKAPNETGGKRRDARNALQKKGVIAIENNMCWVINGLEENL